MYRKNSPIKNVDNKWGMSMDKITFKEFVDLQIEMVINGYTDSKVRKLEKLLKKLGFSEEEIRNDGLYTK